MKEAFWVTRRKPVGMSNRLRIWLFAGLSRQAPEKSSHKTNWLESAISPRTVSSLMFLKVTATFLIQSRQNELDVGRRDVKVRCKTNPSLARGGDDVPVFESSDKRSAVDAGLADGDDSRPVMGFPGTIQNEPSRFGSGRQLVREGLNGMADSRNPDFK